MRHSGPVAAHLWQVRRCGAVGVLRQLVPIRPRLSLRARFCNGHPRRARQLRAGKVSQRRSVPCCGRLSWLVVRSAQAKRRSEPAVLGAQQGFCGEGLLAATAPRASAASYRRHVGYARRGAARRALGRGAERCAPSNSRKARLASCTRPPLLAPNLDRHITPTCHGCAGVEKPLAPSVLSASSACASPARACVRAWRFNCSAKVPNFAHSVKAPRPRAAASFVARGRPGVRRDFAPSTLASEAWLEGGGGCRSVLQPTRGVLATAEWSESRASAQQRGQEHRMALCMGTGCRRHEGVSDSHRLHACAELSLTCACACRRQRPTEVLRVGPDRLWTDGRRVP